MTEFSLESPSISPFWPAACRIIGAGIQERRTARFLWMTAGLLVLAIAVGIAIAAVVPDRAGAQMRLTLSASTAGVVVVLVALMWWAFILQSALEQHSSFEASLVPTMAKRIPVAIALFGGALSLSIALTAAAIGANFWLAWSIAIAFVSLTAWLFVQPLWLIGVVWGGSMLSSTRYGVVSDILHPLAAHDPRALFVAFALATVFATVTLRIAFSASPERKEKMRKRMATMKKLYAMDGSGQTAWSAYAWNGWTMKAPWSYLSRMKSMLAQRTSIDHLVPMMFGQSLHWSTIFNLTLGYGIAMMFGRFAFGVAFSNAPAITGFLGGSVIFAFLLPIITATTVRTAFWQSRGEQALLLLTPLMPQGAALNRLVAMFLLKRIAFGYFGGLALLVLADQLTPAFSGHRDQLFAAMLAVPAPMIAFAFFPAARMHKPGPLPILGMVLLAYVTIGVIAVEELFLHLLPTGGIEAVIVALSGIAGVWRYQSFVRGPCQFPVGRFDSKP